MAELKERINGAWVSRGQVSPQDIGRKWVQGTLEDVTITPSESQQTRTAGQGYAAIRQVVVNAVPDDYVGSGVTRKAAANYTPSESTQTIAAGQYLDGAQTINAISSTYVGSGITRRSSTDLTVSGATVNVPAGYYSSAASKSIPVYDGSVS